MGLIRRGLRASLGRSCGSRRPTWCPSVWGAASEDDWDAYESLHWRALEDWLAEHPDDPDVDDIRKLHEEARDQYLTVRRGLLDWGIFVGRKHGDPTRD
jgi:hypothetical protein